MNSRLSRYLVVLLSAGIVLLLDRLSKLWVLDNLKLYEGWTPIAALAPYFEIFHTNNTGVAFGLFRGGGPILAVLAGIAIIAILIFVSRAPSDSSIALYIGLGLIVGGAAGNLWDRLAYGHVIDFLDFRIPDVFHWATFNIADTAVVVGVGILLIQLFLQERRQNAISDPA